MSWYKHSMPCISDAQNIITSISKEVGSIPSVVGVYVWGSYVTHINQPHYVIKDIDIIAATKFHSGDLLAIDNGKYSALHIHTDDLLDEGFNPSAVNFTKKYLALQKYNIDHWATCRDDKLLHWGAIADSQGEWAEIHNKAEKEAIDTLGVSRGGLYKASAETRREWREIYDEYIAMFLTNKNMGWCESSSSFTDIEHLARKI